MVKVKAEVWDRTTPNKEKIYSVLIASDRQEIEFDCPDEKSANECATAINEAISKLKSKEEAHGSPSGS